tara:strand:- start:40 stop:360 length:321 start_codon:yes stop_codon:yes gene_type:complete
MKIRWIIEARRVLQKSEIEEAESMATYFIGSFATSEEPLYIGPFDSEEEATDIAFSMPADQFTVAVRQFMETEQEMKQVIKDLAEGELGLLMQTFFMVQEKIYARD